MDATGPWTRILTAEAFLGFLGDGGFEGDGLHFVIRRDGTFSGSAGDEGFGGTWVWQNGFFCRTLVFRDEPPETDCEIIEICGDRMRYTRNRGQGSAAIAQRRQAR